MSKSVHDWIHKPKPSWRGPVPVIDPSHNEPRWAVIAPGCDWQPHNSTRCGCRRFDDETEAVRYHRDQRRRHEGR